MTYDFFADSSDKIEILNFIFNETDLQIFDLASVYEQEIARYRIIDDITSKFDLRKGGSPKITFQLWSPRFKAAPNFRKVILDPKFCNGHTYRFATEGWGLIQLYFGGVIEINYGGELQTRLHKSHLGHFNHQGALAREDFNLEYGKVDQWDWMEIKKTSSQLKNYLHNKLAVKKKGTFGILKGAETLERSGVILAQ